MNVSAPVSGPHSKSMSGQWTWMLGSPGKAPRTISSMLGCVAAVSETESPSQLSPALIQRTCSTGSAGGFGLGDGDVVALVMGHRLSNDQPDRLTVEPFNRL